MNTAKPSFVYAVFIISALLLVLPAVNAYHTVSLNRIVYVTNDTMRITGTTSAADTNLTATFYDSSGSSLALLDNTSSGTTYYFYHNLNFSAGGYYVIINDSTSSVNVNFTVVAEKIYPEAHMISGTDIKNLSTGILITSETQLGGAFGELLNLSISGVLHYGNATISSKTYHFVLIDQNYNMTYDTLYVDDDILFMLYNDTEDSGTASDTEKALNKGGSFKDYIIGDVDFYTGNKTLLAMPSYSSAYTSGYVDFMGMAKNSNGVLLPGQNVTVKLLDSSGSVVETNTVTTNAFGYYVANFSVPASPGTYTIDMNNGMGTEIFSVESFKLYGKVTDTSDSPAHSFASDPTVRLTAIAKSGGSPVSLTTAQAVIYYPNGTSRTVSLSNSSVGVYSHDLNLTGAPNGEYGVKLIGIYGDQQEFRMGFAIETVALEAMAINPQFIDQASEGTGAMVTAFAPGSDITIMVALSNISAGGLFSEGPPGEESGIIDIDDSSTSADECETLVSILELKDEKGISYSSVTDFNYTIMNLSRAMLGFNMQGEGPPQSMMRQCMVIINNLSRKGSYRLSIQVNHNGEKKIAGSGFDIQRVLALGDTVDFKGDEFGFFAPNSTVRIKLKITDMLTHNELPAANITNAKIVELIKVYPAYREMSVQNLSESAANGTIQFVSPNEEGFFSMKFRFKANVGGSIESGTGTAFFQLKKYMIWGNIRCERDPCYVASGQDVTLDVTVVDIDKGTMMDLGMSSGLTCTNCEGLIINVSMLRNEQLMKEVTEYSMVTGALMNASNPTNNITIVPNDASSLPTGWYGVDLILTDPTNTNNTYFGFAWFEIRNFYVEMIPVSADQENLTAMWQEPSYAIGQPVLFGIMPRNPSNPEEILTPSTQPYVESVKWMSSWPPPPVPFNVTISRLNVTILTCQGSDCPPPSVNELWVINITGLSKSGNHQANVRVNVSGYGSDVGSFFFSLSSFKVSAQYRGMESWPPVFSPSENLTVTFIGCEFGEGCTPHNLSGAKATVFDRKRGEPLRLNYTTSCNAHICVTVLNLSQLSLNGKYEVSFRINDTAGNIKESGMEFVTRSAIIGVPRIEETWTWYTDTTKLELNLENDRDRCDNQKYLMNDDCEGVNETVCLFGSTVNILVNGSYHENSGNVICIGSSGAWDDRGPDGCGSDPGTTIYIVSNTTHIWVGESTDLRPASPKTMRDVFNIGGRPWNVTNVTGNNFRVRHAGGFICGESWSCSNDFCQQSNYTLLPNTTDSEFYHGLVNLVEDTGVSNNLGTEFDSERYVYIYHNKTHLWVSQGTDMRSVTPKAKNEIFSSYGEWKVSLLNKQQVELEGQTVLAKTGAYLNTSLSRSGVFKLGRLDESNLGSWNKDSAGRNGMDLTGNGETNNSAYFVITDNATSGIYDTFLFSKNNNFTRPIPISSNMGNRTFGLNDTLTLLNIDPRASTVKFYSNQTGDWSQIGEYRVGSNITIPMLVSSPSGSGVTMNVSISWIRRIYGNTNIFTNITPVVKEINYLGELSINVSSFGPGEFVFQIAAGDVLEEWKWPRATTRTFLVDSETCEGGYVHNFKPLPLTRYDWENYGEVRELYSFNWTEQNQYFNAVFSFDAGSDRLVTPISQPVNYTTCGFARPGSAGAGSNVTLRSMELPGYYFFLTDANLSKVWVQPNNSCNFVGAPDYDLNSEINLIRDSRTYAMRVIYANSTTPGVITGLAGFDDSQIMPLRIDSGMGSPSKKWRIMSLNLSGTYYNVVLSNDTTDYPLCVAWNMQECAKMAWFKIGSDFTSAVPARIGQNFTNDLYLAKVGPGPWDGVTIANFSQVPQKPAVDVRTRDSTTSYFATLEESAIGIDLDMDNVLDKTFYAVAFDSKDDSLQNLTDLVSDDDNNITEDWWSQSINGVSYYKDFHNNETGMRESRNNLPKGISNGNIRFGEINNSLPWESSPEWEVLVYNMTDMLIRKSRWMIDDNSNMTLIVKAYNFDQTPIQGANITLSSVMRMGFGFQILNSSYYTLVNVQNVTDQYGYGIIKLAPVGTWSQGEYMVTAQVRTGANTETINRWFRVTS